MMTSLSSILFFAAFILLAVLILKLWDHSRSSRRPTAVETTMDREAYVAALRNPSWTGAEARLGRPIPSVLRLLYSDDDLLSGADQYIRPPDTESYRKLDEPWQIILSPVTDKSFAPEEVTLPAGAFAFATNGFDDIYYVQLTTAPDGDGPVFITYLDGGDSEPVAPSLKVLLGWPRVDPESEEPAT